MITTQRSFAPAVPLNGTSASAQNKSAGVDTERELGMVSVPTPYRVNRVEIGLGCFRTAPVFSE